MISHDADKDMVVIVVTATDEDSGENGRVMYEILQGNFGWAGQRKVLESGLVLKNYYVHSILVTSEYFAFNIYRIYSNKYRVSF